MNRKFIIFLILFCYNAGASNYEEALDRVREASYKQSGLETEVNTFTSYMENKGYFYAHKLKLDKPVGVCVYLYKVYREKSITIPIGDKKLWLSQNEAKITLPF